MKFYGSDEEIAILRKERELLLGVAFGADTCKECDQDHDHEHALGCGHGRGHEQTHMQGAEVRVSAPAAGHFHADWAFHVGVDANG